MSFTMDYARLFALLALMLPLYAGVRLWLLSEPPARTEVLIVPETVTVHVPFEVPVDRVIFVPVPASGSSPVEETPDQEPLDAEDPESTLAPPFGFLNFEPAELSGEIDESPIAGDAVPGAQGTESSASTPAAPVAQQPSGSSGSPGTPPLPFARPPPPIISSDPEPITGPPSSQPTAASNPPSVRRTSLSAPPVITLPVVVQPPPAPQAAQGFLSSVAAPVVAPENSKPLPKPADPDVDKPKPTTTDVDKPKPDPVDDDKPKAFEKKEGAFNAAGKPDGDDGKPQAKRSGDVAKPDDDDRKFPAAKYAAGSDWDQDEAR